MSDHDLEIFLRKNELITSGINSSIEAIRDNHGDVQTFYALAVKALEPYVASHPQDAIGHARLGYAYFRKGLIDQAISEYERSLRIDPGDYSVRHDLGEALREKGYRDGGC